MTMSFDYGARSSVERVAATLALCAIASCGGSGDSPTVAAAAPRLLSMLQFDLDAQAQRDGFVLSKVGSIGLSGQLQSQFLPAAECQQAGMSLQILSLRWTNEANAATQVADIRVFCQTGSLFGLVLAGIGSEFQIAAIPLELGDNRVRFEVFDNGRQVGLDFILIVRIDGTQPQVADTYPPDGATGVPIDRALVARFDTAMSAPSLTDARFVLTDAGGAKIAGRRDYHAEHSTWQLYPDTTLAPVSLYTVTISGDVEDATGHNRLGADWTWTFTTGADSDVEAPAIVGVWPGAECECAPGSTRILARLSEPLDVESLAGRVALRDLSGALVPTSWQYRELDFLELVPDVELSGGMRYVATVGAGLRDLAGNATIDDGVWEFTTQAGPPVGVWTAIATDGSPADGSGGAAVWTGSDVLFWGIGEGGRYDPIRNAWSLLPTTGTVPSPRTQHSAVWTGAEMIVWGGRFGDLLRDDGGAFDPATERWTLLTPPASLGAPATYAHAAIWTGTDMIVWGGRTIDAGDPESTVVDQGFRYSPATGIWRDLSTFEAPSPRAAAAVMWTGAEMIVWGGVGPDGPLTDGARYDPIADRWTALPAVDPPLPAGTAVSAVWSGTEMLAWNGGNTRAEPTSNDRFRTTMLRFYDPVTNRWRASSSGWEPFLPRSDPHEVGYRSQWTGSRMLVFSMNTDGAYLFDPSAESWQPLAPHPATGRDQPVTVWADDRWVVWGGVDSGRPARDGFVFEP